MNSPSIPTWKASWKAAAPYHHLWGRPGCMCSTYFGADNPFNELILDIRAGKKPYSLHRTTFDDALQAIRGLHKRICQRQGKEWTPQAEDKWWTGDAWAFYGDKADQKLDCLPAPVRRGLACPGLDRDLPAWSTCASRWMMVHCLRPTSWIEQMDTAWREVNDWCRPLKPLLDAAMPRTCATSMWAWTSAARRDLTDDLAAGRAASGRRAILVAFDFGSA